MEILQSVGEKFLALAPRAIMALALFVVFIIAAGIIAMLLRRLLKAIRLDQLGEKLNEIDFIEKSNVRIKLSKLISKGVYYLIVLIGLMTSAEVLGIQAITEQIENLVNYIPKIFAALLIFIIGLFIANFIKEIVASACKSLNIPAGNLISVFVFYFLLITVTLSALAQADINTTFITSNLTLILGGIVLALGIGYGFASRNVMTNLLSSLHVRKRFKIGDVVKVGANKGEIIEMDNTTMTIFSEGRRIVIPLGKVIDQEVEIF